MGEYKENVVYEGNLVSYINGSKRFFKKTNFIYSEKEDCFIDLIETLNLSFDLLISDNKEDVESKINKHKYPYKYDGLNNSIVVDVESLEIIAENKGKGR